MFKVKDIKCKSGGARKSCPFYVEVDQILGTRAASSPPVVLENGGEVESVAANDAGNYEEGCFFLLYDKY